MLWGSKGRKLGNAEGLISYGMVQESPDRREAFKQDFEGS